MSASDTSQKNFSPQLTSWRDYSYQVLLLVTRRKIYKAQNTQSTKKLEASIFIETKYPRENLIPRWSSLQFLPLNQVNNNLDL